MQSSNIFAVLLLFTLLAPLALATETEQLFVLLDQNQDGWLVEEEIEDQHRRLFQRLLRTADDNQDRRLSSAEFQTGLEPQLPAKLLVKKQSSELPGANALLLLLAKMDTNGNGQIEEEELPEQFLEIFQRIEDRLGGKPDGILDRRELTQAAPRLSQIALRIAERMDLDVEVELALLSEKQWRSVQKMIAPRSRGDVLADPQRARKFFHQLDANGDHQISRQEASRQLRTRFEQLDRDGNGRLSRDELVPIVERLRRTRRLEYRPPVKSKAKMLPE